jgi:V/A-type H+-transporting ATPase subunit D
MLKAKARAVINSVRILKARKQALIKEFLDTTRPFLRSRTEIRQIYSKAIRELILSLGREGRDSINSITAVTSREFAVEITEKSVWGLKYKEVTADEQAVRDPGSRGYDYLSTTHHLEDGIYLFEKIVDAMVELAAFETKLKRLGEEIVRTTRRIRVLEERVLPDYRNQTKMIADHIGERERETFCRLKRFKEKGLSC